MTQTDTHPHRSDLRRRADQLIAALDAMPAPQTLPDIMRTARALMVIDRLLSQLWKIRAAKPGRQSITETPTVPSADSLPDDVGTTTPPVMATVTAATPPLNRHQRRLQAARDRSIRPDTDPLPPAKRAESQMTTG
jgi:hypothetical protein